MELIRPAQTTHKFISSSALSAHCEYCTSIIVAFFGSGAVQCSVCSFIIHDKCKEKAARDPCWSNEAIGNEHALQAHYFNHPVYCVVCRKMVVGLMKEQGYLCTTCSTVCHFECKEALNRHVRCPRTSLFSSAEVESKAGQHQWSYGNWIGECEACGNQTRNNTFLSAYKCLWCSKKLCCLECLDNFRNNKMKKTNVLVDHLKCDGGYFKDVLILPSNLITASEATAIADEEPKNWKIVNLPNASRPIIAFVNPKSGGNLGQDIIVKLNKLLNPHQVFDLNRGGPKAGLEFIKANSHVPFVVLACGGDGTVSWVFSIVDQLDMPCPPCAHLPLGTGNDLARTLGWGPGISDCNQEINSFVDDIIEDSVAINLDRWNLNLSDSTGNLLETKVLNNYFSIGIDAKIALQFHEKRNSNPEMFKNQTVNKMWYGALGSQAVLTMDGCAKLSTEVALEIDGVAYDITQLSLEAVVLVNLPSCYGGATLWPVADALSKNDINSDVQKNYDLKPQSINDGLIEVVGVRSASHLGNIQMGIADPVIIGQGKVIRLTIQQGKSYPYQVDGEPYSSVPGALFHVELRNQSALLAKRETAHAYLGIAKKKRVKKELRSSSYY